MKLMVLTAAALVLITTSLLPWHLCAGVGPPETDETTTKSPEDLIEKYSMIQRHKRTIPEECLDSYETIECYSKCVDPPEETIKNKLTHMFCSDKCQSDPIYWSCMADCDERDHTKLWNERCNLNVTAPGKTDNGKGQIKEGPCKGNLNSTTCRACLENATGEELWSTCDILYNQKSLNNGSNGTENLCQRMDLCVNSTALEYNTLPKVIKYCTSVPDIDKDVVPMCVNDLIMIAQRECCKVTLCQTDQKKCAEICPNILSPHLCQEKCWELRDPEILRCFNTCNFHFPKNSYYIEGDRCQLLCNESNSNSQNSSSWTNSSCHNVGNYKALETTIKRKYNIKLRVPEKLEDLLWISSHFTPLECSNGTNTSKCLKQVVSRRSEEEIRAKCEENPYRIIDMIVCTIGNGLRSLVWEEILEDIVQFKRDYCFNETLREQLIAEANAVEKAITCLECNSSAAVAFHNLSNLWCRKQLCQKREDRSRYCEPLPIDNVLELSHYAACRWKVDLAKSHNPYNIWATYFDELVPTEIQHKVEHPDTTYILPDTVFRSRSTLYTFPYFVLVRAICDEGFYEDDAFKVFMEGENPRVQLSYIPYIPRHFPTSFVTGDLGTALINLKNYKGRFSDLVPENPFAINGSNHLGCNDGVCYPAFVAPLIFHHTTMFEMKIAAHALFHEFEKTIYVSAFHSRLVDGKGEIQIAARDTPAHAGMLFPKSRATFVTDSELLFHSDCILNNLAEIRSPKKKCPPLEYLNTENPNSATTIFEPLDTDDIFRAQYTFRTSPVKAFAGFYDPRYMIIADPDMERFDVVNWGDLFKELEKKPRFHSCVNHNFLHRGKPKPMYSLLDRTDPLYPINFYRQRYAPLKYFTEIRNGTAKPPREKDLAETAIFEAIGLHDRLLLLTTKGLISFYGQMNATVSANKAWKYFDKEIVNKCFKIVRVLPSAQPKVDTIVGITYDYVVKNTARNGPAFKNISQEMWIGKFYAPSEPIHWMKVRSSSSQQYFPLEDHQAGDSEVKPVVPQLIPTEEPTNKPPGLPHTHQKTNPKSQIEAICYKALTGRMQHISNRVTIEEKDGWCVAMDATPVQMRQDTLQVLVRMRAYHNGEELYFYLVASGDIRLQYPLTWSIDAIIPRIPCVIGHFESIKHVYLLGETYFDDGKTGIGCHQRFRHEQNSYIYLHGMTYGKTLTSHLFLYGSTLLHSTNNGKSFVKQQSFVENIENPEEGGPTVHNMHRIKQMAFDNHGHYAFLTNRLELWLGSTGTTYQIRLRPSFIQTMAQMRISKQRNLNDGVPFAIDFDSHSTLYEVVIVKNNRGVPTRIMKRPVGEAEWLRARKFLTKLQEETESRREKLRQGKAEEAKLPLNYNTAEWSTFCAYLSPTLLQNYSVVHSRGQKFRFPQPEQHLVVGKTHVEASVLAYQAATFHLIWNTVYEPAVRLYKGVDRDPFLVWKLQKRFETVLGKLRLKQGKPSKEYGIDLKPLEYIRSPAPYSGSSQGFSIYYMDYGMVIELKMEFSFMNDYTTTNAEFVAGQSREVHKSPDAQLNIENSNGTLLRITTEKKQFPDRAAVLFIVRLEVNKKSGLKQVYPGENFIPIPVTFHFIGAFGECTDNVEDGIIGDRIQASAMVGCPTGRDLVFDWNTTLKSIRLRGDNAVGVERTKHGKMDLCHRGTFACFFVRKPIVLHFEIFDEVKQTYVPYKGNYIMRIVGGGRTWDKIEAYSKEQVESFNFPGVSDVSLIWTEWDPKSHMKIHKHKKKTHDKRPWMKKYDTDFDTRELVLRAGESSIVWACHTLSPCARISPSYDLEVVYWFRIYVSNRFVDKDTLCLYEKEFDIMLYGFPPSPEFQLLMTVGFALLMFGILYVMFRCCRNDAELWTRTKVNARTWFYIVQDAIPKKLRIHEPPMPEEAPGSHWKKHGKDLSPRESSRESISGSDTSPRLEDDSSASTLDASTRSHLSQRRHRGRGTKEKFYDILLQKKLDDILEKNRALQKKLLKKTTRHQSIQQESTFEEQFGATVSKESVFTPPIPKQKKTGAFEFMF